MVPSWVLLLGIVLLCLVGTAFFHPFWLVRLIAWYYPRVVWFGPRKASGVSTPRRVFLTIDDVPSGARTEAILNLLHAHNAKATFFCIGSLMKNHPNIARQIVTSGHSLGNHTMFDRPSVSLPPDTLREEIQMTETLIESAYSSAGINNRGAIPQRFFRPGHGTFNNTLLDICREVRLITEIH